MAAHGEIRIVVCGQPADLYALRKTAGHRGSADCIDELHDIFREKTQKAVVQWSSEARIYAVFLDDDAEAVASAIAAFAEAVAGPPAGPPIAMGVSRAPDADVRLDDWHPSLRSEAVCIAGALADIAAGGQVLTDRAFRGHPVVASSEHVFTRPDAATQHRVVVALARRLEVDLFLTPTTPELAIIANFPVLRPYLKAIEDMVVNLFKGTFEMAQLSLATLADAGESVRYQPFQSFRQCMLVVSDVLERIATMFDEVADLEDEKNLSKSLAAVAKELGILQKQLETSAGKQEFSVPQGSYDKTYRLLSEFLSTVSRRIKDGDAADGPPPFFSDVATSWT